jgi:hypothetical protein
VVVGVPVLKSQFQVPEQTESEVTIRRLCCCFQVLMPSEFLILQARGSLLDKTVSLSLTQVISAVTQFDAVRLVDVLTLGCTARCDTNSGSYTCSTHRCVHV